MIGGWKKHMKKILLVFFLFVSIFIISSCSKDDEKVVKILVPSGAPTLGLVQMWYEVEKIGDYELNFESKSGTDPLTVAFTSKSHEIIIAPSNLGANLFTKSQDYIYAGTLTFGNLYLVSREEITLDNLEGKTINAFGKNSTPDIILKKVLGNRGVQIDYDNSVNDVLGKFVAGSYDIALLAEPVLSKLRIDTEVYIIDLQAEYQNITGQDSYPQAGIFINKSFAKNNKKFITSFLEKVVESVDFVNTEKESASDYYKELNLLPDFPKQVLVNSIEGSNIGFVNSKDSKKLIEEYFQIIMEFNPQLIGGKLPDDDFYLE